MGGCGLGNCGAAYLFAVLPSLDALRSLHLNFFGCCIGDEPLLVANAKLAAGGGLAASNFAQTVFSCGVSNGVVLRGLGWSGAPVVASGKRKRCYFNDLVMSGQKPRCKINKKNGFLHFS